MFKLDTHLSGTEPRQRKHRTQCCSEPVFSNGSDCSRTYPRTRIVSFKTQDSCAAYATPPALGRLTNESGPVGMQCISPKSAIKNDVFPEPVGPTMRLSLPRWKNTSSSTLSRNVRLCVPPGVDAGAAESLAQEKYACRIPIVSLCSSGTEPEMVGSSLSENSSMSSVYDIHRSFRPRRCRTDRMHSHYPGNLVCARRRPSLYVDISRYLLDDLFNSGKQCVPCMRGGNITKVACKFTRSMSNTVRT